jgi:voltage-gated potassium channel
MGHLLNRFFSWLKRLLLGDFKQLLVFLIFLFIFRPYNTGIDYVAIWNIFFTGVLLAAIFNCHHTIGIKISALILGIPTFIINWWSLFLPAKWLFIGAMFASLIFLVFSIFSLLKRVVMGKVTADVLRGTICVYFMIGFAFAIIYTLIELFHPNSFNGLIHRPAQFPHGNYHSEMVYFSFITLIAIGYGDITPTGDVGQMFSVMEGLIGQFYLAILVARIVSVFALRASRSKEKS